MADVNTESDYTRVTILTILVVAILIVFYAFSIDLISLLDNSVNSFQSSSSLVLIWRISCLLVGISAIVYMLKCGPGNMRVISMKEFEEVICHPVGLSKFVTFSSWTLLSNVAYFLFSKKIHNSVWPSVLMCLIGGLLLSELNNIRVRFGDSLVIIGAFFWAFHIVFISKVLKIFNFPITIATFQCLSASIISFIPAFAFEYISFKVLSMEFAELLYAGVLSSGIAFMLQIFAQQRLSPAPVAIIFSLEGVFGSIAAWIFLSQYLNEFKIFGIIIILSAVIFSQLAPIYGKKVYGRN